MEKRTVAFLVMSLAFFLAVNYVYPLIFPPPPRPAAAPAASPEALSAAAEDALTLERAVDPGAASEAASTETAQAAARDVTVDTPEYAAVFSERGGRLKSFALKKYHAYQPDPDLPAQPQNLVDPVAAGRGLEPSLGLRLVAEDNNYLDLSDLRFEADSPALEVGPDGPGQLKFVGRTARGLEVVRTFTFTPGSYVVGQEIRLINATAGSYGGRVAMSLSASPFNGRLGRYDSVAGCLNRALFTADADDAGGDLAKFGPLSSADWLGYMSQYFLTAFILSGRDDELQNAGGLKLSGVARAGDAVQLLASWPLRLSPGAQAAYDFSLYYGPKDAEALAAGGHNLSKSVDLGWFGFLAKPLSWLLRFFHGLVGNYGVAIIVVTVIIKALLWPLTAKSYKSMKAMQKLQPRIMALREKHKDDREAMNREMMQLYKAYKVNPLGGCLPMLLQIPFFIAFYRVLDYALELRGAPFVLWIQDLSAPDRLFNFGVSVPFLDPPTGIPVMTLLMAASMVWQQKMTPAMGDPMQAKMMMLMPLFFSVILLNMPAGLVLYWLVNNILSIFQQKLINRPAAPAQAAPAAKTG
jgi:YidC/Oxa1 family membrane protein insertase